MDALTIKIIITVCLLPFMALGLAVLLVPFLKLQKVKATFDVVTAECIRVDADYVKSYDTANSITLKPIWQYEYNGECIVSHNGPSASYLKLEPGTKMDIYVNPENPEKIVVPIKRDYVFTTVFGALWTVVMFIVMIAIWTCDFAR